MIEKLAIRIDPNRRLTLERGGVVIARSHDRAVEGAWGLVEVELEYGRSYGDDGELVCDPDVIARASIEVRVDEAAKARELEDRERSEYLRREHMS